MQNRFIHTVFICLLSIHACYAQQVQPVYSSQKSITASQAAVVSAHPLASEVGISMLSQGGNAFDAAIATQLALAVVYPNAGNIGGGGMLVAHQSSGRNFSIDYREKAPGLSTRDMFLDNNRNPVPNASLEGHLAAGVPGTVAGLFATLPYARLPFQKLIEPAIKLAEYGFQLTASQADLLNKHRDLFIKLNRNSTAFTGHQPWKAGDTLIQKDLANTLRRIMENGQAGFYEGATAGMIVQEMKNGSGIISLDDLKNYRAVERDVVDFEYRKHRIISMPLPSSGGIILQQVLTMMETRDLKKYGFQSTESIQLMTEAERRAYADRAWYYGDPDFVEVPVKKLTNKRYLRERLNDFSFGRAGNSTITREGYPSESMETTHISIIDREGNAVSVTTTLNGNYGSKTVVSGAGFILNNEMDDFSIKPGVANLYGVTGHTANAIVPGKRMLSSMTPTIILKKNKPFLVLGTPGGSTIPTSVFQTIVNVIDFGLSPDDAVNQPKFHHQWLPDVIDIEEGFPTEPIKKLEDMGYRINRIPAIGRVELIRITYKKNKRSITAVADRRGDDDARGL